jgi:excisionase family DNA binding protein
LTALIDSLRLLKTVESSATRSNVVVPRKRGAAGEEYIAPAEAARLLKVSPRTITRWAREGRLPSITTLGGHRRFPRAAIEGLAAAQLARSEPQAGG